ncbi:hypothetical protein [uncultured Ruegeria sp.]|uniref:hypothetical protein n=1 Tax=uncultured Ruegeria sp. TaxID=259304 RepID=UPI0026357695|nr:hypothetical protein [uncultured Ruegeria sp.]
MPFKDTEDFYGPLALPEGLSVTPTEETPNGIGDILGAAFRTENPVVSALTSFNYDPLKPFDPEYRPWDDIQGTEYEGYAGRFAGARDVEDVVAMKAQIDRERDDRGVLDAAGGLGVLSQMGAALLSPSSLIPGGAVVKGAKGVSIARTGLTVAGSAAFAAALDETVLQGTQETRTATESAFAIGGSFVLGGVLGAAAGKVASAEFKAASLRTESAIKTVHDVDQGIRSLNAAATVSGDDFKLRREHVFQSIKSIPLFGRFFVGSDPLLRTTLSEFSEVRAATARLAEPVLELDIAKEGRTAFSGQVPVETRVKTRRNTELTSLMADLTRFYAEYERDGPVGAIGTMTAPLTGKWAHLLGKNRKLSIREFSEEVAKAMRRDDKHPIPQVQSVADAVRRNLFDPVKKEAEELGLVPDGVELSDAGSYLSRIYNIEKINAHYGDDSADDIFPVLQREFLKRRQASKRRIAAKAELKDKDLVYANQSDEEVATVVAETIQAIKGLKPGQAAWGVALGSPTRARVLDVPDEVLEPWLESDVRAVMARYFETMVPDLEIIREFGDIEMNDALTRINEEEARALKTAKSQKERSRISKEANNSRRDLLAMRDRIRGSYKLPENPRDVWIVGSRIGRSLSYTSLLGGFMLSALPDLGTLLHRSGIEAAFGSITALTDPKKLGVALKDASELGAASEWYLNGRAMEISNLIDPYGSVTRAERIVGDVTNGFSYLNGVIPWNAGWKTVGGAFVSSRIAKAADAVRGGSASKKQLRHLAANGIEPWMAERIAKQIDKHGDTDDLLWLPHAGKWDDRDAFRAFQHAMNREFDLMVITPGQDKPLAFSTELGKFFFQFKNFAWSAHHRIVLAGIQRADAATLATFVTMLTLGALTSNIKADVGGYDRKTGSALWEDALDRSGLAGWLFEIYNPVNALMGGALSPSGEVVSRWRARSEFEGLAGPTVDIAKGAFEGINAVSQHVAGIGKLSTRDIDKIGRTLPGNNLWYLLPLLRNVERSVAADVGAK